ncbi:MAG: hypothetical protein BGO05_05195 [Rhizobiales bacterium 63-7]|nr:hypothetical protein [Hyphomicrobiales bacterium]OJU66601.1 MAG: hypothetical protein BGO05_05195 [Rhizobiales bacterium 63-7]
MADLPILFSAPMVRAVIAGNKKQTRRIVKPQPTASGTVKLGDENVDAAEWQIREGRFVKVNVGDRFWVRETLKADKMENILTGERDTNATVAYYAADDAEVLEKNGFNVAWGWGRPLVPSIHMPRVVSRITLIVEGVKVERLQDISEADAIAEGIQRWNKLIPYGVEVGEDAVAGGRTAAQAYRTLWNHINGPEAWDANPWVVAYTFRRIMGNIDQIGGDNG